MEYTSNDKEKINTVQLSTVDERIRWGNKLYFIAWTIEIIAALIGLFVAYKQGSDAYINHGKDAQKYLVDVILGVSPFIIVALVEVLKIPIVYLVYINRNLMTKVFFSVILLFLTLITFETVVSGFERQYTNLTIEISKSTKKIDRVVKETEILKSKIEKATQASDSSKTKGASNNLNKILANIGAQYESDKNELTEKIGRLRSEGQPDIQYKIKKAQGEIDSLNDDIDNIDEDNKNARVVIEQKDRIAIFYCGEDCVKIEAQIKDREAQKKGNKNEIKNIKKEKSKLEDELSAAIAPDIKKINGQIEILDKENKAHKKEVKENAEEAERIRLLDKTKIKIKGWIDKVKKLEKIKIDLEEKKDTSTKSTQIYRFTKYRMQFSDAKVCKTYYDDTKKSIITPNKTDNELGFIQRMWNKFIDNVWGSSKDSLKNSTEEKQCKEYETKEVEPTEADVTITAFWWYGSLAALVSIMGIVLAFGALILKHPKEKYHDLKSDKHSIKNSIRRLLIASIKFVKAPREKKVFVDKVVFKDVPVETIKTEIVHVPLYTSDPDLLKFGTTKIADVLQKNDKK